MNVAINIVWFEIVDKWLTQPIAEKYFQLDGKLLKKIENDVSLTLINSHFTLFGSRPLPPNIIEIGGINLKAVGLLPVVSRYRYLRVDLFCRYFSSKLCFTNLIDGVMIMVLF